MAIGEGSPAPRPASEARRNRRHEAVKSDQRSEFERDRDRLLYCSAFRRLAGVTQIVRAGEADVFHTRLTHSLKVAQLGRRIAQRRIAVQPDLAAYHGVDPEVVEAACLAHDLGHPPFGHLGETKLNELVLSKSDPDGYEGNAQSLRVVAKLAVRFSSCDGLDLSRAVLAACIKYPWMRDPDHPSKSKKWGVYRTELDDFEFARSNSTSTQKTAEAELMDWADDIAYSVHDLEDFHRCGAIPWHRIFDEDGQQSLIEHSASTWWRKPSDATGRLQRALRRLVDLFNTLVPEMVKEPYTGTRTQRLQIRVITSQLIGRYLDAIQLREPTSEDPSSVSILSDQSDEVRILKQVTRDYVLANPALVAQQRGQGRIIGELFDDLFEDLKGDTPKYLPPRFRHFVEDAAVSTARKVADCISSLTEAEAIGLHARLRGYSSGSVLDPIVR